MWLPYTSSPSKRDRHPVGWALLGLLAAATVAGCVTVDTTSRTVAEWGGYNVARSIPPDTLHPITLADGSTGRITVLAAGNRAQHEGRVDIRAIPTADLTFVCNHPVRPDEGVVVACTLAGRPESGGRHYSLYVDDQFPDWVQQIYLTEELGHVGQFELNLPRDHAGFTDPTIDLIRRLGG